MMTAVNAEQLVRDWLSADSGLVGWRVSLSVPSERPERFITVERLGGASDRFLDRPLIAVQVWASSRWEACDAAVRLVRPRLLDIIQRQEVGSVSIESIVDFQEPTPPYQARYQVTMQIVMAAES